MASRNGRKEAREMEPRVDIEAAIKTLRETRSRERGPEAKPESIIKGALDTLPRAVRERLESKLDVERAELIGEGVDEETAAKIVAKRAEREATTFREAYEDKRFYVGKEKERMPKDEYAKADIQDEIDTLLGDEPTKDDLKKLARLSFDANGLKAANDLSGSHEKGTEFLKRMADVFHNPTGPTRTWLKEQSVTKVLATTGGGDEYGVLLVAEKPIDADTLSEAIKRFEEEISATDVSDIVDFSDPEVLIRYAGVAPEEFRRMSKKEQADQLEKIKAQIPKGAEFRATVSGGGATLADGLERALGSAAGDRQIKEGEEYRRSLEKIMGGIFDVADENSVAEKSRFKEGLRRSENALDRFYSQLLARTAEARVLEQKIAEQADQIAKSRVLMRELTGMVAAMEKAGLSPADLRNSFEEKLKQFEI